MKLPDSLFSVSVALGLLLAHAQATPTTEPVNPNTSTAARKLLAYLVDTAGNGITLSGQQELEDANWVTENVGHSPAVLGVDLMDYSPSRVEFGASASTIEDAISYSEQGGIITFCWHWGEYNRSNQSNNPTILTIFPGSPSGSLNTSEQPWYSNFYTEATSFNLASAMDESSPDYKLIIRDIDAIAEQLTRLNDLDIPVLFRPLHEAEGGWFWWGAQGPEACKELYYLLFDRLTNTHGLNNLIWVWNSVAADWYPGNDYVDIVSTDIYGDAGDHSSQISQYQALQSLTGDFEKLVALAEVGNIPDPELMSTDGAHWAYWVTWNGDFIQGETNNAAEFKKEVYSSELVYTLDEIEGWGA
ncbi:putative mannan endo-1,4-beta-mannosidase E [Aspergillus cavernicola]|uniref:Mannan endo-1,4-beta-mannosidase E n=1 Tax=Aspergillus cavernicola TaxID=176166 RepID=A0ABR4HRB5_9EURO